MGDVDVVVCGGVEGFIEVLFIVVFFMMWVMLICNDEFEWVFWLFDKDCDGFVFGEVGVLMFIEMEEYVKVCGVKLLV